MITNNQKWSLLTGILFQEWLEWMDFRESLLKIMMLGNIKREGSQVKEQLFRLELAQGTVSLLSPLTINRITLKTLIRFMRIPSYKNLSLTQVIFLIPKSQTILKTFIASKTRSKMRNKWKTWISLLSIMIQTIKLKDFMVY